MVLRPRIIAPRAIVGGAPHGNLGISTPPRHPCGEELEVHGGALVKPESSRVYRRGEYENGPKRSCPLFEWPTRWRRKEKRKGSERKGRRGPRGGREGHKDVVSERQVWRESSSPQTNLNFFLSLSSNPLPVAAFAALQAVIPVTIGVPRWWCSVAQSRSGKAGVTAGKQEEGLRRQRGKRR